MRILSVLNPTINDYQISGAAIFPIQLGEALIGFNEVEVDYVASESLRGILPQSSPSKVYTPETIRKHRCTIETIEYAKKVFYEGKYDIMHVHIPQMSVLSSIKSLLLGTPVVYTQHNAGISGRFSLPYREDAKYLSEYLGARVVMPSPSMLGIWKNYIGESTFSSVRVINNGVADYKDLIREKDAKDCDYFVSIGRLEPSKGMGDLAALCDKYNHKIVFVAGESMGSMKVPEYALEEIRFFNEICDRRKDIITRYEYLPNREVRKLLLNSRGYITFSNLEAGGLSVLEAVLSGCPMMYYEEDCAKACTTPQTSVMVPKSALYRKTRKSRIDIYEQYFNEFNNKIEKGLISSSSVRANAETLGITMEDCAKKYHELYKELLYNFNKSESII